MTGERSARTFIVPVLAFVAVAAIVAVLVVVTSDGGDSKSATRSDPTTRSSSSRDTSTSSNGVSLPDGTDRYVALGDSYSSGEGVEPFEKGATDVDAGGDDCHRSERAYARRVDFADDVKVDFRACSGAVTSDVFDKVQSTAGGRSENKYGKQVESDTLGDDVGLVTLTLGGNDADFAPVLQFCAAQLPFRSCLDQKYTPRDGSGGGTLKEWADTLLPELGTRLETVYSKLRDGAPNARIVALGYPHLFLDPGAALDPDCPSALKLAFSDEEQKGINALVDRLNTTIYEATARAGVEYVEMADMWKGHEPCAKAGSWMNLVPNGEFDVTKFARGAFHPNAEGQGRYAKAVGCYLGTYTEAPEVDASGKDLPSPPGSADRPLEGCS